MANTVDQLATLDSVMSLEKSQEPPVDASSFFMIIKGHEDLSVQIQTGGLPLPKKTPLEYSTLVGVKSETAGKIQMWQTSMPISFIEREDLGTKDGIVRLLADNFEDRNNLTVEFWVGNARDVKGKKWGELRYAFLSNEDGGEFDVESEGTPLKLSGATISGWLVMDCNPRNNALLASAISSLEKLKVNQGLESC